MTGILSLISGSLFRDLERKVSRNDKEYLSGTLKAGERNDAFFVRLFVFSESAQQELEGVRVGDSLAVTGGLNVEIYEGKPSISMTVNKALVLKKEKRATKPKANSAPSRNDERAADYFGDNVPF